MCVDVASLVDGHVEPEQALGGLDGGADCYDEHGNPAFDEIVGHQTNAETGERTYFVSWRGPAGGRENATRQTRRLAYPYPYP